MKNPRAHEILKYPHNDEMAKALRDNDHPAIKQILDEAEDPSKTYCHLLRHLVGDLAPARDHEVGYDLIQSIADFDYSIDELSLAYLIAFDRIFITHRHQPK